MIHFLITTLLFTTNALATNELPESTTVSSNAFMSAIELPHLLQVGMIQDLTPQFTLTEQLGGLGLPLPRSRSVIIFSAAVVGRYHLKETTESGPFLGMAMGYQRIHISLPLPIPKAEGETQTPSGTLKIGTFYLTPHLGWQWNLSQRLSLAMDLGWQVAVFKHAGLTPNDLGTDATSVESARSLSESAPRALRHLAGLPLPSLTLARFIYKL